jgi:hypothetical protein
MRNKDLIIARIKGKSFTNLRVNPEQTMTFTAATVSKPEKSKIDIIEISIHYRETVRSRAR